MLLSKILVVIVGLVMSVVGALSPTAMFASKDHASAPDVAANTAEETLTTLRTSDGSAFARVNVLWVEVDGHRVTEDAWGTGAVEELKFKVGVKDVSDAAVAVGDKTIELHPTDIITIRMFRGDFSYRGMGTALSTVQLQGTVKTTVLKEGDVTNRVQTNLNHDLDLAGVHKDAAPANDSSNVAYVVLTTGEKVKTVSVDTGGARLFTQEATTAAGAKSEPGNLLAKWVKIDGKIVREYTWGDGTLQHLEFEPASTVTNSVVLDYNGDTTEIASGERVVIDDFVGEYLIYQVSGNMMRVRLDGYSASMKTGSALTLPPLGGGSGPIMQFDMTPISPKTTDTVQFSDGSQAPNGVIVFRQWDFGDNTSSAALSNPTHRYAKPGAYEVRLTDTDNDLQVANATQTIIVRNAEPVADFDFSPKVVTTQTMVAFTDQSFDNDGHIQSVYWDFGDGQTNASENPSHLFHHSGNYTVTITATDDMGATTSLSKVVIVRNDPPVAGFTFTPGAPATADPIQFIDNSSDSDGHVVLWNWSFGDGSFGAGSAPIHAYTRPGVFTITQTVTDDSGDADTVSTNVMVSNRPPIADFTWAPDGQPANIPITFTATSIDPDGVVIQHRWNFGDGSVGGTGTSITHTFPTEGHYFVTLASTDNTLGVGTITKEVNVTHSAPHANFGLAPNPAFRGTEVALVDSSTSPDHDALVNWTWDLGDGAVAYGRVVYYNYSTLGTKTVTMTVTDNQSVSGSVSRPIRILNRPPTISADFVSRFPTAGEDITFTAQGVDPDVQNGPVTFEWAFSDGVKNTSATFVRNFTKAGNYSVVVRAHDGDGGISQPIILGIVVGHARPHVNFSFTPDVPLRDQLVQFHDLSTPAPDAGIKEWHWSFGVDSSSISSQSSPTFAYTKNGTFHVTLQVVDVFNQTNVTTKDIFINVKPQALFTRTADPIKLNVPVQFTDQSIDPDGFITNWTWQFGDGSPDVFVRHPTFSGYTAPGAYKVNLTVKDNNSATDTISQVINVADTAPIADWTFTTNASPQIRNVPFWFDGGDHSSDPDGQPIASWSWNFGDGSQLATQPNVSHTFLSSGFKLVGLTVSDGIKTSARTPDSHKTILVGASHPVVVHVKAQLPGERAADITNASFHLLARLPNSLNPSDPLPITINGTGLDVTIPQLDWLNGMSLRLTLGSSFTTGGNDMTVTLRDDVPELFVTFDLSEALRPSITPASGDEGTILPMIFTGNESFGSDPLYNSMTERPHGTGIVKFADGTPAEFANVQIQARWVPLRVVEPIRDTATPADAATSPLIGWCLVGTATTVENGTYDWSFDGTSGCVTNAGSLYPLGRWEVRAFATLPGADSAMSATRALYVDPTGGVILGTLGGLA